MKMCIGCASLTSALDRVTYYYAEIGFSVFFGIGVGAVFGTALILLYLCIMKWKKRFLKQKEKKFSVSPECIPDMLQKFKRLLDDGAITEDEYTIIKKTFLDL